MSVAPVYCINHPKTETLLRCNKCGNPVCIKCVVRTPVGYRCKTCMNVQQAGYYNATAIDYIIVAIVGTVVSLIGGGIALVIGNLLWFANIFYAPAAGGVIAEIIRWSIQKRRAKYIWLVACATVIVGALLVAGALPLLFLLASLRTPEFREFILPTSLYGLISVGIYIVMAVGTVYARLRS